MKKHGMVPDHSLFQALASANISKTPKNHYKRLEEGSIVLKKSETFSFCKRKACSWRANRRRSRATW
jgi:dimethylaniline monooxygenase (N-oxide forming)